MTAAALLDALAAAGCEPAAVPGPDGPELEFLGPAGDGLDAFIPLLKSGVVALLTGRRWFMLLADGHALELNPRGRLPQSADYLAVELRPGDPVPGRWDRVRPGDRRDRPECFAAQAEAKAKAKPRRATA